MERPDRSQGSASRGGPGDRIVRSHRIGPIAERERRDERRILDGGVGPESAPSPSAVWESDSVLTTSKASSSSLRPPVSGSRSAGKTLASGAMSFFSDVRVSMSTATRYAVSLEARLGHHERSSSANPGVRVPSPDRDEPDPEERDDIRSQDSTCLGAAAWFPLGSRLGMR